MSEKQSDEDSLERRREESGAGARQRQPGSAEAAVTGIDPRPKRSPLPPGAREDAERAEREQTDKEED